MSSNFYKGYWFSFTMDEQHFVSEPIEGEWDKKRLDWFPNSISSILSSGMEELLYITIAVTGSVLVCLDLFQNDFECSNLCGIGLDGSLWMQVCWEHCSAVLITIAKSKVSCSVLLWCCLQSVLGVLDEIGAADEVIILGEQRPRGYWLPR